MRRWHFEDEAERRKWQDPEAILKDIGVKPGITFMDIGCGQGFFTLPAARMAGLSGKVYGVDIDGELIAELRRKADREGLSSLELNVAPAEEALLCRSCADIVFLGIVLHDFHDPTRVLQNSHQMLKPTGYLVNLDWKKISMPVGPPVEKRFDEATAALLIESAGFKVMTTKNSGSFHYLITASPA
jgi:ubiquinone/menaquinone biosynthesis C-methylase UbiE